MKEKDINKTKGKKIFKIVLQTFKVMLILGVLVGFLGGGVALGMVAAALQNVPAMDRDRLENPSLPTIVVDRNGNLLGEAREENRILLSYDEIPRDLINAFIATEDNNFYNHPGFDIRGLVRAALTNAQGNTVSGGSTITQQTAKQIFLHRGRSMERKIQEFYLALQIEKNYSKQEIMEFYLNSAVQYGGGEFGVGAAARSLWNKSVDELTLSQMATLAGIPNWPTRFDPRIGSVEAAITRRNHVLSRMLRFGYITRSQYDEAIAEEFWFIGRNSRHRDNDEEGDTPDQFITIPHYGPFGMALIEATEILRDLYGFSNEQARQAIRNRGYTIRTTIDIEKQRIAESIINDDRNFTAHRDNPERKGHPYQGLNMQEEASATLIDVRTGEIIALVTGRNAHPATNANLRPRSPRSPGSAIKPIISYGPAFESRLLFPGSVVDDAPLYFPASATGGLNPFTPENFFQTFDGLITVREALIRSLNVPSVVANRLDPNGAISLAQNLGLTSYKNDFLAIGVGVTEVTNIQITSAYSAFANGGVLVEPNLIKEIVDRNGRVIYTSEPHSRVVMSEETAFLITDILREVDTHPRGTARAVRQHFQRDAAMKTGTSENFRDSWLVGYTPQFALGVWVGWDLNQHPVPIGTVRQLWGKIMAGVHRDLPNTPFPPAPNSVVEVAVSTKSGLLPSPLTPPEFIRKDYFVRGFEPREICNAFVEVTICRVSGLLASDSCPPHHRVQKVMLAPRQFLITTDAWRGGGPGRKPADVAMMAPTEVCTMHDGNADSRTTPSNLVATLTNNGIRLQWNASNDVTGFNIYRRTSDTSFVLLNSTPINVREFLDTTVRRDVEYFYYVTAITRDGSETRSSNTINVTLSSAVQRVTDFRLVLSNNSVELSWDPALNATHYRIFRSTQEGSGFTEIQRTNRTTFIDSNVQPGTTYFYYIVAEGADPSPIKSIAIPRNGNGNGNGDDDDNGDD